MKRSLLALLSLSAVSMSLAAAGPAAALTYVLPTDAQLVDHSPLVATVTVEGISAASAGGAPATDYQVRVERVVKGAATGETLVVRVPGGVSPDGSGLRLWGTPAFAPDEEALLFLRPHRDGTYRISGLALGAFHREERAGGAVWTRPLTGTVEIEIEGTDPSALEVARMDKRAGAFVDWIADRAAGKLRAADYAVAPAPRAGVAETVSLAAATRWEGEPDEFGLFNFAGFPLRWFEFDTGGEVPWHIHEDGQPGLPGGGTAEFEAALEAWEAEPRTAIVMPFAGTTSSTGGFSDTGDERNTLLFGDPNGFIGDPFTCSPDGTAFGILAVGGPRFLFDDTPGADNSGNLGTFRGDEDAIIILEAEIVVNAGVGCIFPLVPEASPLARQVFTHELGHALGIDHSCGDFGIPACGGSALLADALMRADVVVGRDGRLAADDRAAARFLYPAPAAVPCLDTETSLCLNDRFLVEVDFGVVPQDGPRTTGEAQTVPLRTPDSGLFWFFDPDNWELLIKVIDGCVVNDFRWVFAAATTNVEYLIQVTDVDSGIMNPYFKPAGPPAPAITDTTAFASCPP